MCRRVIFNNEVTKSLKSISLLPTPQELQQAIWLLHCNRFRNLQIVLQLYSLIQQTGKPMVTSQLDFKLFSTTNLLGIDSSIKSLNEIHCNTKYIETTNCTAKSRQVYFNSQMSTSASAINLFCNVNKSLTL
jgi:hypothetical protein